MSQAIRLPSRRSASGRRSAILPSSARRRDPRRRADQFAGWGMVSPSVLLLAVFGMVPVVWAFVLSFQRNDLQTPARWVGLHNYRELIHDPIFRDSIHHTIVYTALFVPITLVLSLVVAAALNRKIRFITLYRLAVFVPVVTSTVATGVIFTWPARSAIRDRQRNAAQSRSAHIGLLLIASRRAVCHRRDDRLGLGRIRGADFPGRAAIRAA